ncbi:MAG: chorismate synthase [Paludibacteraceae bacterium]|nr:chorismate synthase [Paludibacteraceae bacterium]
MANVFGDKWSFTSFGESHGAAIGGVLDGVPAGLHIDFAMIREELERRAGKMVNGKCPNGKSMVSPRALREPDEVEWLSGVIESDQVTKDQGPSDQGPSDQVTKDQGPSDQGPSDQGPSDQVPSDQVTKDQGLTTLGTPIAFLIRNKDARPEDYEFLKHSYRTGHADQTYEQKYGIRDWRGGGRASARETAARVVAGCIAKQALRLKGITIHAALIQVGAETDPAQFAETIAAYQRDGDSIGGIIECRIKGLQAGVGEPIFNKLQAELAFAVMSINACKGFEYGTGFEGVTQPGSEINHISGGIAGGIADGTDITFRCVFKPTPSTPKALAKGQRGPGGQYQSTKVGRHDACVAVRAVPVVEAMAALALIQLL